MGTTKGGQQQSKRYSRPRGGHRVLLHRTPESSWPPWCPLRKRGPSSHSPPFHKPRKSKAVDATKASKQATNKKPEWKHRGRETNLLLKKGNRTGNSNRKMCQFQFQFQFIQIPQSRGGLDSRKARKEDTSGLDQSYVPRSD